MTQQYLQPCAHLDGRIADQAAGSMEPDRFYDCWDPDVDLEVLTVQTNMLKERLAAEKEKRAAAEASHQEQKRSDAEASHQVTKEKLEDVEQKRVAAEASHQVTKEKLKDVEQKRSDAEASHQLTKEKLKDVETQLQAALSTVEAERKQKETAEQKLIQIQEQKPSTSHGACWQYEIGNQWHPFPPEGNDQMLQAYLAYLDDTQGNRWASIVAGGVERVVDFYRMTQTHATTQKVRNIRLTTGVPAQWESTPAELLMQRDDVSAFYIEVKDASLAEVVNRLLRSTGHAWDVSTVCSHMLFATVKSVHRIENYQLWQRYQARLRAMREDRAKYNLHSEPAALDLDGREGVMTESQNYLDCGEPLSLDVDEKILLHGTSWYNANSIVENGFDHRTCTRGMYGDGVYFACAACKSHQYSCGYRCGFGHTPACRCERTLIIARVALGDACHASETRYGARRPPARSGATGTYGSVVVKPGQIAGHHKTIQVHQEFVIFDREQAYPAFVVQYWP
ncbi:Tnks [Symbiodinium sp. KB8]|nr:Tnks [Symbiodinium sp. KB8]